jgi:hypothetical protein
MASIAQWPMALIPLFGVGLSGTVHLIAFDLLRKSGLAARASAAGRDRALRAGWTTSPVPRESPKCKVDVGNYHR